MFLFIVFIIFSFLFEGLISNYTFSTFTNLSLFSTLYTLISLVIIFPYFHNKKKYIILLITFSILIDIVYTNTFLINFFLFIIIYCLIKLLNSILPENILTQNLISLFSILIYHILSYIILKIINYTDYPFTLLINIILNSLLMTIIYSTFSYLILKKLTNKFNIKQIR